MEIEPVELHIPTTELDDLRRRLAETRWPEPLPGDSWDTGVPTGYLRRLAEAWTTEYDWQAREARLNAYPQFVTRIDGTRIHFVHVRSPHDDALPLVLTHGWPGSIFEFLDIIDSLTDPPGSAHAFHVVIPSLPGFTLSGPTSEPWYTDRIAEAWVTLMDGLGYREFGVQGGDIGAAVSPAVARIAPDRVVGVHLNGSQVFVPPDDVDEDTKNSLSELERDRLRRIAEFMEKEFGYIAVQSTRPQTLAYGLTDSPVGQLAWMVDKFKAWTWPFDALPEDVLGVDRLLDHASLYWFTRTAGTSAYTGYATESWGPAPTPSNVPTAFVQFAHDVGIRRFEEQQNDVRHWTDVDRGGHFAAMEEPAVLVDDMRRFFAGLRRN
ncbi:epoxide hydrolase family protein [Rhodococcoides yunnanense]|uniref:epoxide hydrolase family protein n=1 Tax=Rhodococcoides yunnanense TaxID=278209 RepID=UPI000934DE0C|nr:epoxide hydrolase [Rhodococcus yunnanensis]